MAVLVALVIADIRRRLKADVVVGVDEARRDDAVGADDLGGLGSTVGLGALTAHAGDGAGRVDEHLTANQGLGRAEHHAGEQPMAIAGANVARAHRGRGEVDARAADDLSAHGEGAVVLAAVSTITVAVVTGLALIELVVQTPRVEREATRRLAAVTANLVAVVTFFRCLTNVVATAGLVAPTSTAASSAARAAAAHSTRAPAAAWRGRAVIFTTIALDAIAVVTGFSIGGLAVSTHRPRRTPE